MTHLSHAAPPRARAAATAPAASAASPATSPTAEPVSSQAILEALVDAVLVIDGGLTIRFANGAAQELFAAGHAALVGQPLSAVVPEDSPITAIVIQVRHHGAPVAGHDLMLDTPRTGRRELSVVASPLAASGSTGPLFALHLRQSGLARDMERQNLRRGASRSVAGFHDLLVHEVRNPLAGMRGAAQLLSQRLDTGKLKGNEVALADLIRDEVDRVAQLMDSIAVFSDDTLTERLAVNIHEVLDHVQRLIASAAPDNVRFEARYDPSLPPVLGHRDQLIQVVLNLVKNAVDALSPNGGRVRLATAFQSGVRVRAVDGVTESLPIRLTVEDDGPGIAAEFLPRLFEPFVTTRPHGRGLGLALVAKLVDDHRGRVEVSSRPRQTIFEVYLPAADGSVMP